MLHYHLFVLSVSEKSEDRSKKLFGFGFPEAVLKVIEQ